MSTEQWKKDNAERMRLYRRDWYHRNKATQIPKVVARNVEYQKRNREFVNSIKATMSCVDCGISHDEPEVMEFDHVRGEKTMTISKMVRHGASIQTILAEIEKCDLVCAVCHRVRTVERRKRAA